MQRRVFFLCNIYDLLVVIFENISGKKANFCLQSSTVFGFKKAQL